MTGGVWAERSLDGDDGNAEHLWILQQDDEDPADDEDEDEDWDDDEDWDEDWEDEDDEDEDWEDEEEADGPRRPSDDDWL